MIWHDWHIWHRRHLDTLPPGLKPISFVEGPMIPLETLRSQCEVVAIDPAIDTDHEPTHPDDALILGCLDAAVEHAEDLTGLTIALRTYEMSLDSFPVHCRPWQHDSGILIPRSPFISVERFFAPDGGSSDGEFDLGDDFIVDDYRRPTRLLPVTSWPAITRATNAILIRFKAGYRTESYFDTDYEGAQVLPSAIRQALLLLTAHFFENRAETAEKAISSIPLGVDALLKPKQVRMGFA